MKHYYNDSDPYVCKWIENLVFEGLVPYGDVDGRSIVDVSADDVRGYTQAHFFCGIAGWPLALKFAGWPEDRNVWTGSCPCQPFSTAGVGAGFDDERHLWPHFFQLIRECRPAAVFGEQVASKAVDAWIDLVLADLESVGYAGGAIAFPSAGVGAPHIRDRLCWVAHTDGGQREGVSIVRGDERDRENARRSQSGCSVAARSEDGGVDDPNGAGRQSRERDDSAPRHRADVGATCRAVGLADSAGGRLAGRSDAGAGPTNGHWRDADWLACRDGKWRPVEPGALPLAHGVSARVGRLRAYGNAINPQQAAVFIEAVMECMP